MRIHRPSSTTATATCKRIFYARVLKVSPRRTIQPRIPVLCDLECRMKSSPNQTPLDRAHVSIFKGQHSSHPSSLINSFPFTGLFPLEQHFLTPGTLSRTEETMVSNSAGLQQEAFHDLDHRRQVMIRTTVSIASLSDHSTLFTTHTANTTAKTPRL